MRAWNGRNFQRELGFLKTDIDAKKYLDLSLIGEAANRLN